MSGPLGTVNDGDSLRNLMQTRYVLVADDGHSCSDRSPSSSRGVPPLFRRYRPTTLVTLSPAKDLLGLRPLLDDSQECGGKWQASAQAEGPIRRSTETAFEHESNPVIPEVVHDIAGKQLALEHRLPNPLTTVVEGVGLLPNLTPPLLENE